MHNDERETPDPGEPERTEDWPSEDFAGRPEPAGDEPREPRPEAPWPDESTPPPDAVDAPPPVQPPAAELPAAEPAAAEPAAAEPAAAGPPVAQPPPVEPPYVGPSPADQAAGLPSDTPEAHEPPPSEVEAYPTAGAEQPIGAAAHTVPESGQALGESTLCPRCGTENRPGLAFCRNCGQRLMAAGVAPTVERPAVPEGTQACPRCGTHNRSGVAFCQNCGANLRGPVQGYVPPRATAAADAQPAAESGARRAVLGPVVLLIGLVGVVTAYVLPFAYGTGSLYERALGSGGYGLAFWNGYPDVTGGLADQAYFGLAAPSPVVGLLLLALAVAGLMRATPGMLQALGLAIVLVWGVAIAILFGVVELAGNFGDDLVGLLSALSPGGIIFLLSALIVVIGSLTRFARS